MKSTHYLVIGTLAASALAGTLVYASQYGEGESAALPARGPTPISLAQAVVIAERHAQGPAVSGELERSEGLPIFEIDVASEGRVIEVKVDATNGMVIGVEADHSETVAGERPRERS